MSRDWLIAAGLFMLALSLNVAAVEHSPFHPDETRWLNRAHYLGDLADPFGATWQDGYLTRGQPPLGAYLMGAGLRLQGQDFETNGVWDFRYGEDWNVAHGNMASPDDLTAGRRTNAVVGALAVVAAYVAGTFLTNRVGGAVGALLLATHPLMTMLSSQALSDALLVFLLAIAAGAAIGLAGRPAWTWALLLGVALGLGGATKLSPLLLSLPLGALGCALLLRRNRFRTLGGQPLVAGTLHGPEGAPTVARRDTESVSATPAVELRSTGAASSAPAGRRGDAGDGHDWRLGWRLAAVPVIAMVVFVAVYPYLWPDPVGRSVALFSFRVEEMARQGENWADVAVDSRLEALRRVGARLGDQFSATGQVAEWLSGADLAAGIAGHVVLLGLAIAGGADRRHAMAFALLSGQAMLIVGGLRSDFARYHLPIVLVMAIGVGVLAGTVWTIGLAFARWAWRRLWSRLRQVASSPAAHRLGWRVASAVMLLALMGVGSAVGAGRSAVTPLRATPNAQATPIGPGTPVAATPGAATPGATPLTAYPGATPVDATPMATPLATPLATPVATPR